MYDFKQVESEVQKFWKAQEKELEKTREYDSNKKLFSFLEGPPTANAPPALHHIEVRTFKDIFCKYKFMKGFTVPRQGGWDCHGLPVEVQIEKKLGLNSKKEILDYGVDKFTKECRDSVFSYIQEWEENTQKVDYQIDLKKPYRTLDKEYMESVWWSLKELHKKELLYESMSILNDREKEILEARRLTENPKTLEELSQKYNIHEQSIETHYKQLKKNTPTRPSTH